MKTPPLQADKSPFTLSGGAHLKRVIILPFFLIMAIGFTVSWAVYLSGSRAAIRDAMATIIRESSERVATDALVIMDQALMAASVNAALIGRDLSAQRNPLFYQQFFLDQLALYPGIAILSAGFDDGEYVEAQRQANGAYRTAKAGLLTGGALVFRQANAEPDSEPELVRPNYDPRKRPWYTAALEGSPHWTEPYALYSNEDQAMAAAVPIRDAQGRVRGATTATLVLANLSASLAGYREAKHGVFVIVDSVGKLIASSAGAESVLDEDGARARAVSHRDRLIASTALAAGLPRPGDAHTEMSGTSNEFTFSLNGDSYLGLRKLYEDEHGLSWTILSALRESAYTTRLAQADQRTMAILIAFILSAFAAGWWVVSYVTRPLRVLSQGADTLEFGVALPEGLQSLSGKKNELGKLAHSFLAMKRRMDQSYGALETSLVEKEILLKEVHHRVKNNLQIISSILSLQSGALEDEVSRRAFEECQDRIQAMALVHEEVYQSGSFEKLHMASYLNKICDTLRLNRGNLRSIEIDTEADDRSLLPLDQAIPLGLIVNELVTNAIKYAFPDNCCGRIQVRFLREEKSWLLNVTDNGTGLPTPDTLKEGVGTQLVRGLVEQLRGSLDYAGSPEGGASISIRIDAQHLEN
jgi:two-component sensor histidine kinase